MPERRKPPEGFASLIEDAKPLTGSARRAAPSSRKSESRKSEPRESKPRPSKAPPNFVFPNGDNPLLARTSDCDPKRFDALRRGRIAPDESIDLHGLRKDAAREALLAEMRRAWDAGDDCIRVVHGKGRSSKDAPVLRQALPGWLTAAPLAAHVLAFAPAKPEQGGSGATLVLLRPE